MQQDPETRSTVWAFREVQSAPVCTETTTRKKVRLLNQDQKGNLLSRHDQQPTSRTNGYSRQNKWHLSTLSSSDIKQKPPRNNRFTHYIFFFFGSELFERGFTSANKQTTVSGSGALNQTKYWLTWREKWKLEWLKANSSLILRENVCTSLFYYMYNNVHKCEVTQETSSKSW